MTLLERVQSRTFLITAGTLLLIVLLHVLSAYTSIKPLTDPQTMYLTGLAGVYVAGEKALDWHDRKNQAQASTDGPPSPNSG